MAAYLDPSVLLIFFASLALAYGVGRIVRAIRAKRATPPEPKTRAERRRAMRGRK
jgi:hypothetical protein